MGFLIILSGLLLARITWKLWYPRSSTQRVHREYLSSSYRAKRTAAVRDYQARCLVSL